METAVRYQIRDIDGYNRVEVYFSFDEIILLNSDLEEDSLYESMLKKAEEEVRGHISEDDYCSHIFFNEQDNFVVVFQFSKNDT